MAPPFLTMLSDDLKILFLSLWLDVRSLATLNTAISSLKLRSCWIMLLQYLRCPAVDSWGHSLTSLLWLSKRGIRPTRLQINVDAWRLSECDLKPLDLRGLAILDLRGCSKITDECIVDVINRCLQLQNIDLGSCKR